MPSAQPGTRSNHRSWLFLLALAAAGCGSRSFPNNPDPEGNGGHSGAGDHADGGELPMDASGTGGSGGAGGVGGAGSAGGVGGASGGAAAGPDPTVEELICKAMWAPDFGGSVTSDDEDFDPTTLDTFSGTVESIDLDAVGFNGIGRGMNPDQLYSFTVRDGDRSRVVTLQLVWQTPLVEVGDAVEVAYSFQHGAWVPSTGRLTLRNGSGEMLAWIEQRYDGPESLTPPSGFSIADGTASCTYAGSCGDSTRMGLRVVGAGGDAQIGFGEAANVGEYVFLHGDNTDFEFTGGCTDSSSRHTVLVAAVRGTDEGLSARDRGACAAATCGADQYCVVPGVDACAGTSPDAVCTSAPLACGTDCPLVCGCDGKLYCSVCRAQQAGVAVNEADISCKIGSCDGEEGVTSAGPCNVYWACHGRAYGFSCEDIGDVKRCRCTINSETVASVDTTDPQCDDVANLCGFPPVPF